MLRIQITNKTLSLGHSVRTFKKKQFSIVSMNQTHSSNIHTLSTTTPSSDTPIFHTKIKNTDGLITSQHCCILAIKVADCLPIVIYHPKGLLCALHAGRKGTSQSIVKQALSTLTHTLNTTTGFTIWLGPHICEQCYQISPSPPLYFSLINETLAQIKTFLPLERNHITLYPSCTKHHSQWHSYRGDNKTKRRNYIFCYMEKTE